MIRRINTDDIESIANALWGMRRQLGTRQIATQLSAFSTLEALAEDIRKHSAYWLVCESQGHSVMGFFSLFPIRFNDACKRWRFPEDALSIEHFPCLLKGEELLSHFALLTAHLPEVSMLICFTSSLREAYWAALKAGFQVLGESSSVFGGFVWLYLDREGRFDRIQSRMKRAGIF